MRKILASSIVVLMVLFLSAGLGLAGNGQGGGKGGSGNGSGNGTGPIHDILNGAPFEYMGDVIGCTQGQGMEIATTDDNVIIYGMGPVRYWDSLDIARPEEGDTITVEGYAVDYNSDVRNIAVQITLPDGVTVELRDPDTGVPLWHKGGPKTK